MNKTQSYADILLSSEGHEILMMCTRMVSLKKEGVYQAIRSQRDIRLLLEGKPIEEKLAILVASFDEVLANEEQQLGNILLKFMASSPEQQVCWGEISLENTTADLERAQLEGIYP